MALSFRYKYLYMVTMSPTSPLYIEILLNDLPHCDQGVLASAVKNFDSSRLIRMTVNACKFLSKSDFYTFDQC